MSNPVYFTKEDAAKRSGLSVRRIQELAKAGEIRRTYNLDETTNRKIALYLAEDIQAAVRRRRDGETALTVRQPEPPPPAIPSAKWLTLADASIYIGLPQSFLLDLVEHGRLPAFDVGVRAGGRYRVSRKSLDELEGSKFIGRASAKAAAKAKRMAR